MLNWLEKTARLIGVSCIALLFILVILQVFMRYGFGYTHFLTEELGRYLLVWATMAGMALECRRGGHIRVQFLVDLLPRKAAGIWAVILNLIILLLFLLIIYTGLASMMFNHGQESPGLQIPLSFPFAAIPLFFLVAAVFIAERILKDWKENK